MGGLDSEDLREVVELVHVTSSAENLESFRSRLFGRLHQLFPFPIGLFGYRMGSNVEILPVQTDEDDSERLRSRYPDVYAEQAGFLREPPPAAVSVATRDQPTEVLQSLATTQVYWPEYGVEEAVALFFETPSGYQGGLSVCLEDSNPERAACLAEFLEQIGPYVSNTVDSLLKLDELRIRSRTLDNLTKAREEALFLVDENLQIVWMSRPAQTILREVGQGVERLPVKVVERVARIWAALRDGNPSIVEKTEAQIFSVGARRILARYAVVRGAEGRRVVVHLEDRQSKAWSAFEERADGYELSPREREVCQGVIEGLANKEIGDWLGISTQTVKNHLKSVFEKMSARSRADVVRLLAGRPGWDGVTPTGSEGA